ncbi:MAG: hypothetical protein ACM3U2_21410 [Deltaproteobacteria bacterium]
MTPAAAEILELVASETGRQPSREAACEIAPTGRTAHAIRDALTERRRAPRYGTAFPIVAMPVLPNGSLEPGARFHGRLIDIAEGGLGLELEIDFNLVPRHMVVGVVTADGKTRYGGVELRHVQRTLPDRCRLGTHYAGPAHHLLKSPVLVPQFDPLVLRYCPPFDPDVLRGWVRAGILQPRLLDRVQVCPRCETLATFRPGCRACRSGRVQREQLIHHYACAHVDRVAAFEEGQCVRCPKCRCRPLIVGADFDYQEGLVNCLDCGWSGNEGVPIGQCFRCGLRFTGEQTKHLDLIGYDVLRLDPLALLAAS